MILIVIVHCVGNCATPPPFSGVVNRDIQLRVTQVTPREPRIFAQV